jgi:hypothetical protein
MDLHPLPLGHVWLCEPPKARPGRRDLVDDERTARVSVRISKTLKARVEASARLEGVPASTWIARALSRSVDPRVTTP